MPLFSFWSGAPLGYVERFVSHRCFKPDPRSKFTHLIPTLLCRRALYAAMRPRSFCFTGARERYLVGNCYRTS